MYVPFIFFGVNCNISRKNVFILSKVNFALLSIKQVFLLIGEKKALLCTTSFHIATALFPD